MERRDQRGGGLKEASGKGKGKRRIRRYNEVSKEANLKPGINLEWPFGKNLLTLAF